MVQTDISQLSAESAEWRQILRNHRLELNDFKKALQETCKNSLTKEQLLEVEHYDNQFHIQLINIHDLKHEIKNHDRKVQYELSKNEYVSGETFSEHERLLDEFLNLENTLQQLRNEFKDFINATSC
jgi:predicted oxidoreductase